MKLRLIANSTIEDAARNKLSHGFSLYNIRKGSVATARRYRLKLFFKSRRMWEPRRRSQIPDLVNESGIRYLSPNPVGSGIYCLLTVTARGTAPKSVRFKNRFT